VATINTLTIDVVLNGKKAQMGLKQFSKELSKLQKTTFKTNSSLKNIGSLFSGFSKMALPSAILGAATAFAHMTMEAGEAAKSIDNLSKRTGVAPSKLIAMKKALVSIGGSGEDVEKTLTKITEDLNELNISGKTSPMLNRLRLLGVNYRDEKGNTLKADEVFLKLSDTVQQMIRERGIEETIALMRDFPLNEASISALGQGSSRLEELIKELTIIQDKQNENLKDFNDSTKNLTESMQTFKSVLASDVAKPLKSALDLESDILNWFSKEENVKERRAFVGALFGGGTAVATYISSFLGESVYPFLGELVDSLLGKIPSPSAVSSFLGELVYSFLGESVDSLLGKIPSPSAERNYKNALMELVWSGKVSREDYEKILKKSGMKMDIMKDIYMYPIDEEEKPLEILYYDKNGSIIGADEELKRQLELEKELDQFDGNINGTIIPASDGSHFEIRIEQNNEINAPSGNAEDISRAVGEENQNVASLLTNALYSTMNGGVA